jgi:putative ABC transport system substrate-binding protein
LLPVNVLMTGEVERAADRLARDGDGGMVVTESGPGIVHRDLIIALAARNRLPTVYPQRVFVAAGRLISHGSNTIDPYRRAASYVDRILKGAKVSGDWPFRNPTTGSAAAARAPRAATRPPRRRARL